MDDKLKRSIENTEELEFYAEKLKFILGTSSHKNHKEFVKLICETEVKPRLAWDSNNVIIAASQPFLDALGYESKDIIGKSYMTMDGKHSRFITKDTLGLSKKAVLENVAGGVVMMKNITNSWYCKNKEIVDIEWCHGFNDPKTGIGTAQCKIYINMKKENKILNWFKKLAKGLLALSLALLVLVLAAVCFTAIGIVGIFYTLVKHIWLRDYSLSTQLVPIIESCQLLFDGFACTGAGELINDSMKISKDSKVKYGKWYHTISGITGVFTLVVRDSGMRKFINGIFFWQKDHCNEAITPEQRSHYLNNRK